MRIHKLDSDRAGILPKIPGREFFNFISKPVEILVNNIRAALFDFDGTVAMTEHLHRATFETALQNVLKQKLFSLFSDSESSSSQSYMDELKHTINQAVSNIPINSFGPAWGVPERETAKHLLEKSIEFIKENGNLNPEQNAKLKEFQQLSKDRQEDLITGLTDSRAVAFNAFIDGSIRNVHDDGSISLTLSPAAPNIPKNSPLHKVKVTVSAEMVRILNQLHEFDIPKGINTSSPKRFVGPLLEKLEIGHFFYKRVYSTTIDKENGKREGQNIPSLNFKPSPDSWHLLINRLEDKNSRREGNILYFENAASAATLHGKHPQKSQD